MLEGEKRFEARSGRMKNSGYKEGHRINLNKTSVSVIMRKPVIINNDVNAKNIINLLLENEEVLVKNGIVGIVTPKDILKLVAKPSKTEDVQIIGIEDENPVAIDKIRKSASLLISSLSKSVRLQPMKIHIKKHKKVGPKKKYSIHLELPTSAGVFISTKTHDSGKDYSDLPTLAQKAIDKLEKEVRKKIQKQRTGKRKSTEKE